MHVEDVEYRRYVGLSVWGRDNHFDGCVFEAVEAASLHLHGGFFDCLFDGFDCTSGFFDTTVFVNCRFEHCRFRDTAFRGALLVDCVSTETTFVDGCEFSDSRLLDCRFEACAFDEPLAGAPRPFEGTRAMNCDAVKSTGFDALVD